MKPYYLYTIATAVITVWRMTANLRHTRITKLLLRSVSDMELRARYYIKNVKIALVHPEIW